MLHCSSFNEPETEQACLILQTQGVTARRNAEAERLMEVLRRPFLVGDEKNGVELIASASASIGITFSAMYKAKNSGKARYALFDTSLHAAVSERLRLEGELRGAIARGELSVVYRPVFHLGPGAAAAALAPRGLAGFEALVRWRHPTTARCSRPTLCFTAPVGSCGNGSCRTRRWWRVSAAPSSKPGCAPRT